MDGLNDHPGRVEDEQRWSLTGDDIVEDKMRIVILCIHG